MAPIGDSSPPTAAANSLSNRLHRGPVVNLFIPGTANVPLADGKTAERLGKALIAAGFTDPGADGPLTRLMRLPVGANGKHEPPFSCQMRSWRPDLRYTVQDLVNGLGLDLAPPGRPKATGQHQPHPDSTDPVWTPSPTENAVLATLRDRGLYKSPLGGCKHDITCPWVHAHTGAEDHGTAYFEPAGTFPITTQDITPYGNGVYHLNSILQPSIATTAPLASPSASSAAR